MTAGKNDAGAEDRATNRNQSEGEPGPGSPPACSVRGWFDRFVRFATC